MQFDVDSKVFVLAYNADSNIDAPTEVFLPPHIYETGYEVSINTECDATWDTCVDRPNVLCVLVGSGAVILTVSPKKL